jgi:hypothetical protein
MKRIPVNSSNVAEVGYDPSANTLEVLFKNGGLYQYFDVPQAVYEELIQAASVGKYLNTQIKLVYRYARI